MIPARQKIWRRWRARKGSSATDPSDRACAPPRRNPAQKSDATSAGDTGPYPTRPARGRELDEGLEPERAAGAGAHDRERFAPGRRLSCDGLRDLVGARGPGRTVPGEEEDSRLAARSGRARGSRWDAIEPRSRSSTSIPVARPGTGRAAPASFAHAIAHRCARRVPTRRDPGNRPAGRFGDRRERWSPPRGSRRVHARGRAAPRPLAPDTPRRDTTRLRSPRARRFENPSSRSRRRGPRRARDRGLGQSPEPLRAESGPIAPSIGGGSGAMPRRRTRARRGLPRPPPATNRARFFQSGRFPCSPAGSPVVDCNRAAGPTRCAPGRRSSGSLSDSARGTQAHVARRDVRKGPAASICDAAHRRRVAGYRMVEVGCAHC